MNTKEKQIEEIARTICGNYDREENKCLCDLENGICDLDCWAGRQPAEALYQAGYQKQEWISVKDRLPEPNVKCLGAVKVGSQVVLDLVELIPCFDCHTNERCFEWLITYDRDEGEGCEITHWMPLPEPPKMKGGAE